MINLATFDEDREVITIRYANGVSYEYGKPLDEPGLNMEVVFITLVNSERPSAFFNAVMRGHFPFRKIEPTKENANANQGQ
jgi:hypothetical protein